MIHGNWAENGIGEKKKIRWILDATFDKVGIEAQHSMLLPPHLIERDRYGQLISTTVRFA